MDIISAYREVGTYRGAAEICQTTHKTVRRVLERAEAGDFRPASKVRVRNFESVTELVWKRVDKSKGRISAKRPQVLSVDATPCLKAVCDALATWLSSGYSVPGFGEGRARYQTVRPRGWCRQGDGLPMVT